MPFTQFQVLLKLFKNSPATSMNTEMLKSQLEIRDIWFNIHFENFPTNKGEKEKELFRKREDKRAKSGDVCFKSISGDGHEIFGEGDTYPAGGVFFLEDTTVGVVIRAFVSAD